MTRPDANVRHRMTVSQIKVRSLCNISLNYLSNNGSLFLDDRGESPVLNLSKPTNYTSEQSGSEGGRFPEDDILSDEENPASSDDKFLRNSLKGSSDTDSKDKANNNKNADSKESNNNSDSMTPNGPNAATSLTSGLLAGFPNLLANSGTGDGKDNQLNNVYGLIGNIQALLKAAVENSANTKDDKPKGNELFLYYYRLASAFIKEFIFQIWQSLRVDHQYVIRKKTSRQTLRCKWNWKS